MKIEVTSGNVLTSGADLLILKSANGFQGSAADVAARLQFNEPHGMIMSIGAGEKRSIVKNNVPRDRHHDERHRHLRSPRRRRLAGLKAFKSFLKESMAMLL